MRAQHDPRRGRRGLQAAAVAVAAALALVVVPATLGGAQATFSATTTNTGDAWATGQLQPPSGLTVTQSCTVPPAITHGAETGATGTSSLSLTPPSGTTAGNVLLAHVAQRSGIETITPPAGWTLLRQDTSSSQVTSEIYWKTAGSAETTAVFTQPSGSSGAMIGGIIAFTGADGTAPVATSGAASGTGTTVTTPSLSTTATTAEVVHLLVKSQEAPPTPAGTTLLNGGTSGSGSGSIGATAVDEPFPGPGTLTSRSATGSLSTEWIAQTVVLRRPAGTPSANLSWTASPSTWASGYVLDRQVGGSSQATQTVPGVSATSTTDGPLTNATSYTYRLTAYRGTWRSSAVTATLTTSC